MSTEPWGGASGGSALQRACEACIRAAGLVEEAGRSGVAPNRGLITIRLADQPVRMTEPVETALSPVRVIDLPPSRTRHRMEDEILVDDVPHVVIDTEEVGPRQPGTWRRLQERVTVIPTVVRHPQADPAHPITRRWRAG